jgi:hypothetical protein
MSGRILYHNPQGRFFVSKNPADGKFQNRTPGIVQLNNQTGGVIENRPGQVEKQPGVQVLSQKPESQEQALPGISVVKWGVGR